MKVYQLPREELSPIIRNMLHSIKYNQVINESVESDCIHGAENFESLTRDEQLHMCLLAVYAAVSFHRLKMVAPSWAMDRRLFLEPPYVSAYCDEFDIFKAYQPSFDHNCFMPITSFDVI
jgi:hypothetical protein